MITFGSVCSGIEAASVAFGAIGWRALWLSEIDKKPCDLLAHYYPNVPNLGDMNNIAGMLDRDEIAPPDVLCGGTPCQAFSVAGNRQSLSDDRGNLTLTFCEIADKVDDARIRQGKEPAIIFWENVPGVLNTKDNAFGCFLGKLTGENEQLQPPGKKWSNAGCVYGPKRAIAWRILDAQHFGLAQRRKRVFVIASALQGCDPAEILFEFGGVRRDTPPSREAREEAAGTLGESTVAKCLTVKSTGGLNLDYETADFVTAIVGNVINRKPKNGPNGKPYDSEVCFTLTKTDVRAVAYPINTQIALRHNKLGERTGLGVGCRDDPMFTLQAAHHHAVFYGVNGSPHLGHCLRSGASRADKTESTTYVAYRTNAAGQVTDQGDVAACLNTFTDPSAQFIQQNMMIRRLLPVECERLQGFPDGYTDVPGTSDSARYRALGNSWAVPVVRWIGRRIDKHLGGYADLF